MVKIVLKCCEGKEAWRGQCLRSRCPHYDKAEMDVNREWPYEGTGFGNLYGNPGHGHYLSKVQQMLKDKTK